MITIDVDAIRGNQILIDDDAVGVINEDEYGVITLHGNGPFIIVLKNKKAVRKNGLVYEKETKA